MVCSSLVSQLGLCGVQELVVKHLVCVSEQLSFATKPQFPENNLTRIQPDIFGARRAQQRLIIAQQERDKQEVASLNIEFV